MSDFEPTVESWSELTKTLFFAQELPEASLVWFANSQAEANWAEARMAEEGHAGKVQYVICPGAER